MPTGRKHTHRQITKFAVLAADSIWNVLGKNRSIDSRKSHSRSRRCRFSRPHSAVHNSLEVHTTSASSFGLAPNLSGRRLSVAVAVQSERINREKFVSNRINAGKKVADRNTPRKLGKANSYIDKADFGPGLSPSNAANSTIARYSRTARVGCCSCNTS